MPIKYERPPIEEICEGVVSKARERFPDATHFAVVVHWDDPNHTYQAFAAPCAAEDEVRIVPAEG